MAVPTMVLNFPSSLTGKLRAEHTLLNLGKAVSRLIEVSSISSGRSISAHPGVSALSPGDLDSLFSISLARAKRKVLPRYQAGGEIGIGSGGEPARERSALERLGSPNFEATLSRVRESLQMAAF